MVRWERNYIFYNMKAMAVADCALAYAVSHQPVIIQAQVEFQVSPHGVFSRG
jgi:hypothetical protein